MSDFVDSARDIPTAPYYVTMTDRFMSGWGPARNRTNKLVFVCDTYAEACKVAAHAEDRSDQKYVSIRSSKPNVTKPGTLWQVKTKATYPHWYGLDDQE